VRSSHSNPNPAINENTPINRVCIVPQADCVGFSLSPRMDSVTGGRPLTGRTPDDRLISVLGWLAERVKSDHTLDQLCLILEARGGSGFLLR
jgi:hypothetical protein